MPPAGKQKPNLEILADADVVARRCLELFITAVNRVLKSQKYFSIAVSGGKTPEKFFNLLAKNPKVLPWSKIRIFWVDERYVPADSPLSNYKLAAETFLSKIPIPENNIHPIPTDYEDIEAACRQYEKTLRGVFGLKTGLLPRFDLVILGLGADGHTASLFPGSNALSNICDLACVVYQSDDKLREKAVNRITLTHPVLCASSKLIILVTGLEKSQILKDVLDSPPGEVRYPVHYLWPALDRITWLVDAEAARLL